MFLIRKQSFMLLEIMIAIAIMTLCILPLLAPHVFVLKQQKEIVKKMSLDHLVNLLYVDVLDQLQINTIPWALIEKHAQIPIDETMLARTGWKQPFPYKGTFRFDTVKLKGKKELGWYVYQLTVTFVFITNGKSEKKFIFPYELTLLRQTASGPETSETPETSIPKQQEQKKA